MKRAKINPSLLLTSVFRSITTRHKDKLRPRNAIRNASKINIGLGDHPVTKCVVTDHCIGLESIALLKNYRTKSVLRIGAVILRLQSFGCGVVHSQYVYRSKNMRVRLLPSLKSDIAMIWNEYFTGHCCEVSHEFIPSLPLMRAGDQHLL